MSSTQLLIHMSRDNLATFVSRLSRDCLQLRTIWRHCRQLTNFCLEICLEICLQIVAVFEDQVFSRHMSWNQDNSVASSRAFQGILRTFPRHPFYEVSRHAAYFLYSISRRILVPVLDKIYNKTLYKQRFIIANYFE